MWIKKGLLYCPKGDNQFDYSHCHKPTPLIISDSIIRVYFGVRDKNSITRTTYVDLDSTDINNLKVSYIHDLPVLDTGTIGAFDDSGANVCSVLRVNNLIYMYYIGWNPSTTVHTRNSIGLAISEDLGVTFKRAFTGSVLDRNHIEPFYTGAIDVLFYNNTFKTWYTSGLEWIRINGKPEISYHIKYATSINGYEWERNNIICIKPMHLFEVSARPCVIVEDNLYKMWYSKRNIDGFRVDNQKGYNGGYAESLDGVNWTRKDEEFGLIRSLSGWDSDAIAYPYVLKYKNKKIMFYNGNSFGKTGFGYAILE
jgi:hypothetical protein